MTIVAYRQWSTTPIRSSLALTILIAAATIALLGVLPGGTPATCLSTHCFCEAPRTSTLLKQPANSLSSFGFVLVGLLILLDPHRGRSALDNRATAVIGTAAIVVGVGSVLLHATLTLWGQFADVVGMYLLGGFMLTYALQRALRLSDRRAALVYVGLCGGLIAVLAAQPEVRRWLFLMIILAALAVEIGVARVRRNGVELCWLLAAIAANATAFGIWALDQQRIACAPFSVIQGHALWHLLGALAIWLTYRYYRSERACR